MAQEERRWWCCRCDGEGAVKRRVWVSILYRMGEEWSRCSNGIKMRVTVAVAARRAMVRTSSEQ